MQTETKTQALAFDSNLRQFASVYPNNHSCYNLNQLLDTILSQINMSSKYEYCKPWIQAHIKNVLNGKQADDDKTIIA